MSRKSSADSSVMTVDRFLPVSRRTSDAPGEPTCKTASRRLTRLTVFRTTHIRVRGTRLRQGTWRAEHGGQLQSSQQGGNIKARKESA